MNTKTEGQSPELTLNGAIATITLRRPDQANRLGPDDLAAIADHIAAVNQRPEVLVLKLCGTGKYFCSGYNITQIGTSTRSVNFEEVVTAVEQARPITIAVLHGGVYGGATDLALACDFRVGVRGIQMFMPAARLGLHYYRSGLERYVSRIGLDNTKRLFLTAEKIDAEQMKAIGYLTQLIEADQLHTEVTRIADACAAMAPIALLGMKKHLNAIARGSLDPNALHADITRALQSDDLKEGQAAWVEKRTPRFIGS